MRNTNITFEKISNWSASKKGLLYIICISVMLKATLLISDSMVNKDGILYIAAAQKIAEGYFKEGLEIFPMPLYSILIAGMHSIIPDWVIAARTISIIFVVLILVPLYLLTKELFDRKAAFWACLIFAIAPVTNGWANSVIRDPGFIFCIAWAVYFAVKAIQSPMIILFAMTALFSWISIMFRVEGIVFILFSPIYFLVLFFMKDQERAILLKGALIFIVTFFLVGIIAVYGWNESISVNRSGDILRELHKLLGIDFLDNYRNVYEQLIKLEAFSPYDYGIQTFAETARHYIPVIYFLGFIEKFVVIIFPLFLIPLCFGFKEPILKTHIFLLFVFSMFFLAVYYYLIRIGLTQSRYLAVPMLMLYPWIGAGMQRFLEYLSGRFSKRVFAAVFILFFILPVYQCFEQEWKEDRSLIAAAKWIEKEANPKKLKIVTMDARFLYYAGREFWLRGGYSANYGDKAYNVSEIKTLPDLERIAIYNKMDLIALKISAKKDLPDFQYFKKIKEFKGRKSISYIYASPEAVALIIDDNS